MAIVMVGAPVVGGTGGTIVSLIGALVTRYGAWLVGKSQPSGSG